MAGESSSSVENNNGKSNGLSSSALAGLSVNETPNPTPTPTPTPIDQGITNTMSSLGKYSMVGESSSSTGNLTSPPVGGGIKYLGTLLPIESLELIPVKNNGQRGRPSLSAFPHPDSTQGRHFLMMMKLKAMHYAAMAPQATPSLLAAMESELRSQMFQYNTFANASPPAQNEEVANGDSEEDEDDDEDDDDYDDESEYDSDAEFDAWLAEHGALNEAQIDQALRTEKYKAISGASSSCPICMEVYEEDDDVGIMDCDHNHKFHRKCIKPWLMEQNTCPMCRMVGLVL
ncbi:probable E3 ubiquitin-protein ligase RHG1A [Spinacia oleracea]|uniref:RING-type E3 ubiquitin transferase n=1 Tax=Spinacia oleracea TaxID=3562 RepID=A0A9R0KCX5_SPIOL|nr:probable E3 ubiquitin-protein ligase RHG1A [Spinacia oleracea]